MSHLPLDRCQSRAQGGSRVMGPMALLPSTASPGRLAGGAPFAVRTKVRGPNCTCLWPDRMLSLSTYRYIVCILVYRYIEMSRTASARARSTDPDVPRRNGQPRVLSRGDLRLLVLALIGEQPRHGYELMQLISNQFMQAYTPSAGTMY